MLIESIIEYFLKGSKKRVTVVNRATCKFAVVGAGTKAYTHLTTLTVLVHTSGCHLPTFARGSPSARAYATDEMVRTSVFWMANG